MNPEHDRSTRNSGYVPLSVTYERLLNSTPYADWPELARAMGWQEPSDPIGIPEDERRWTWKMIHYQERRVERERERQEALAELQRLLVQQPLEVLSKMLRDVRRWADRG